jgi:hypothetical protein
MDFIFDNGIKEIDYDDEYDYYKKINSSNINDIEYKNDKKILFNNEFYNFKDIPIKDKTGNNELNLSNEDNFELFNFEMDITEIEDLNKNIKHFINEIFNSQIIIIQNTDKFLTVLDINQNKLFNIIYCIKEDKINDIRILYHLNNMKKLYGINKKYETLYSKDEPLLNVYFLILTMKDILDELNVL